MESATAKKIDMGSRVDLISEGAISYVLLVTIFLILVRHIFSEVTLSETSAAKVHPV